MSEDIPRAIWSGSFQIGGVEVHCHVLENGQRVIDADSLKALFGGDADLTSGDTASFAAWCRGLPTGGHER